ncbi:MAG: aldehyde dehydrogenase family protein [Halioglobus sp.]
MVVSRSANLVEAIERIMVGKTLNAGQVCIAPDYLLVPEEKLDEVVEQAGRIVSQMYPTLLNNEQYTAMVNDRHYQRIMDNLTDAENRGIKTVAINPANEDFAENPIQKIPPTLIINPDDDAMCMQDEIFGPLLPIKTYKKFEETISYINARPRPLAAYYFGHDKVEEHRFLTGTTSGGVSINDVMFHMLQKDLPFGGIGPSGMGAYHGIEGFKTFSHAKGVYRQPKRIPVAKLAGFMPPYGPASQKSIKQKVKV